MKSAVMVLGMHRSGTSVAAGVLSHLGLSLGTHLLDPAADNQSGYWENATVVRLDERMLRSVGRSWDDPRELPSSKAALQDEPDLNTLRNALRDEFGDAQRIALKDPRMCLFSERWTRALGTAGYRVGVLVVRRHPDAVVQSLDRRDGIHPLIGYALYARYMLAALRGAGEVEVSAVVDYDALLSNWRDALGSALDRLELGDIQLSGDAAERVDAFVDAGMSHVRQIDLPDTDVATHSLRDFAVRVYTFAGDVGNWSAVGINELQKTLADALDGLNDAGRARIDTHIRWCQRHEQEASRLRDLFNANLDQLHRTDQGLAEASELAVSRLATINENESHLKSLEARLEAGRIALDETRADLESLASSERALRECVSNLQFALQEARDEVSRQRFKRYRLVQRVRALQRSVVTVRRREAGFRQTLSELERRLADTSSESCERLSMARASERKARSLSEALERVTRLSLKRLDETQAQEARIAQLEGRIAELESESVGRLEALHTSERHVRQLMDGLERASQLSVERLETVHAQKARIDGLEQRVADLSDESRRRLAAHQGAEKKALELAEGLKHAQQLSLDRLSKIHDQESRLQQLEGEVERLAEESRQRLKLAQERDQEAIRLARALESVTELSERRLEEIHQQECRLGEYDRALNSVTELSLTRLASLEESDRSLGAARNHILDLEYALDTERSLHARSRRQAQRLRGRALRFASDAVNARRFWTWLIRLKLNKRKGA